MSLPYVPRTPRTLFVVVGLLICLLVLSHSNLRAQESGMTAIAATPDAPVLLAPTNTAITTGVTNPPLGVPTFAWTPVVGATKYLLRSIRTTLLPG